MQTTHLTDTHRYILQQAAQHAMEAQMLQVGATLEYIAEAQGTKGNVMQEQVLLDAFNELINLGYLAWGFNLKHPAPPYFHLTAKGQSELSQMTV